MPDFDSASLSASEGLAQAFQSSTDLALRFGLSGTWSATPGSQIHEWVEAQGDAISISRLAPPEAREACIAGRVVPAVKGRTVWGTFPQSPALVCLPNRVGRIDRLHRTASPSSVCVVIEPALAGQEQLPDRTECVVVVVGRERLTLTPGPTTEIDATFGALAAMTPSDRTNIHHGAVDRARLLAKHIAQIPGVSVPHGPPETGLFTFSTPYDPRLVLAEMGDNSISAGRSMDLPEYPGGIVVTCSSELTDEALWRYRTVLESVVSGLRRLTAEEVA